MSPPSDGQFYLGSTIRKPLFFVILPQPYVPKFKANSGFSFSAALTSVTPEPPDADLIKPIGRHTNAFPLVSAGAVSRCAYRTSFILPWTSLYASQTCMAFVLRVEFCPLLGGS
jgi:hypothetical protein